MYIYVKFDLESDDYYEMTTMPDDILGRSRFWAVYEGSSGIMNPIIFDNPEFCGFAKCYVSIDPEDFHPDSGKFLIFLVDQETISGHLDIFDPDPRFRFTFRFKADIDDQKNKEE